MMAPTLNSGLVALRLFQGIWISIAKKKVSECDLEILNFCFFFQGVWTPCLPLKPPMIEDYKKSRIYL